MVSANTDSVEFEVDDTYLYEVNKVIDSWQKRYRLELEEDRVLKLVMKDINNYCTILQVGDKQVVKYKGSYFAGCPNIKIHKDGRLETIYKDDFKANSMVIVAESILKYLLFDIPIEKTINNCNDIFKFMQISHLGATYEKCVQESPNGDIELQRNNRIYASNVPRGTIIKVKADGRRDSLANQPPNPIVDNANELTIDDINKEWYIDFAKQRADDFKGIKRLEDYKKTELLELAKEMNLEVDKKIVKKDLIELIKKAKKSLTNKVQYSTISSKKGDNIMATKQELEEKVKELEGLVEDNTSQDRKDEIQLLHKINDFRKYVREHEFILDKELPNNLGGGEYHSIGQYYDMVQELCLKLGLDFSFETVDLISFEKECTKPANGLPLHVATVQTRAILTDIDTGSSVKYFTIAQGSDTIDKAVSGAETMAFRQWFSKNFTPKGADSEDVVINDEPKSEEPKVKAYIPPEKKEEVKKEVVKQVQKEPSDDEDVKAICENIMKVRELMGDDTWGGKTLNRIMTEEVSSAKLLEIDLKVKNKLEKLEEKK